MTKRYFGSLGFAGWLKLALVVLFIGGLGVSSLFNVGPDPMGDTIEEPTESWVGLLLVAAGIGVFTLFGYLAAILEFVFVESLRSEAIRLRQYARENLRHALWLLLFRAALWLGLFVAIAIGVAAVVYVGGVSAIDDVSSGQIVALLLVSFAGFVGWSAVYTFTTAFVVPIMLHENRGPVGAWRRFASTAASNASGVLGYLLIAWLIGFAFWTVFAVVGLVVGFFGLLLFALVFVLFAEIDPNLAVVGFLLLLVAYLAYQYVVAVFEAPVRSYVRYYALLLLGDTDATLDLIPEQRAAVRADGGTTTDRNRASDRSAVDDGDRPVTGDGSIERDEVTNGNRAADRDDHSSGDDLSSDSPDGDSDDRWANRDGHSDPWDDPDDDSSGDPDGDSSSWDGTDGDSDDRR